MKKLIIPILTIFLTSCSVTNYYQVYKAIPENGTLSKDEIVFEDTSCKVTYNLWAEGGAVGFSIYNKTDNDLTVDLTKTFFVLNGVAYEYYQNRTFSKSSSSGTTLTSYPYYYYWYYNSTKVSGTNSSSFSTSFEEKPELTIPSKTLVNVSEYHISNSRYVNCDLTKYPSIRKVKTLMFDKSNSPFVFYNLISYKTKKDTNRMENKFYVSEITNMPSKEMVTKSYTGECGKNLDMGRDVFKDVAPDKFFIHYTTDK